MTITQNYVKERFDYHTDGYLVWKDHEKLKRLKRLVGTRAGAINSRGQEVIQLSGRQYRASVLIFLWHKGYLPENLLFLDNDTSNTRIENLVENKELINIKTESGYKNIGITPSGTYAVYLNKNNKRYKKTLKTLEEAIEYRDKLLQQVLEEQQDGLNCSKE